MKFQGNFIQTMEQLLSRTYKTAGGVEKLDNTLCQLVATAQNMEAVIEELHTTLDSACRSSFRLMMLTRTTKKSLPYRPVPWWTQSLTILRKKAHRDGVTNARKGILPYVTNGKNNTWPPKQSMRQPSGRKDTHPGRSFA
jgi:hypothetical protein